MKLKLTVLALAGAMSLSATAQTAGAQNTEAKNGRTVFVKSPSANWFITLQGGASVMALGNNGDAKFSDRLTFTPSIAVGKYFNPYFASRIKVQAGQANTYNATLAEHTNKFVNGHLDFMLDLTNLGGKVNKNYFLHVIPFVGLGYEVKFDSNRDYRYAHAATANAGLQLAFRLSKRVDFVLEGEATYNGMRLTTTSFPVQFENKLRYSASAGLTFRVGKTGFVPFKIQDDALLASLNSQIDALRAENAELSKRPVSCPEVVAAPQLTAEQQEAAKSHFLAEKSILFKHGKSDVSEDQLITVFDASEFVNKHNGEIIVTGYIQKAESRFKGLAEKRAQAVAKVLTDTYNVPSERITIEYKGADEAPFDAKSAAWNRVVIIRSK